MATRGYYEEYNVEELKDLVPQIRESVDAYTPQEAIEDKLAKNDDRFKSKTWTEAYKMAAFYFDNPLVQDRVYHFHKFRFHFGSLLQKTTEPSELPDLRSRNDFVAWVCKKHNQFLEKEEGDFKVDCSNVNQLIQAYGPNYDNVKGMLGEYEFFH